MGIMGAAIGTLTARIVELIIVIWYAKVKNHDVRFHPVYMRKIDKVLLKDFLIYASPVILNEMMWGLGSTANTAVIGHLGSGCGGSKFCCSGRKTAGNGGCLWCIQCDCHLSW